MLNFDFVDDERFRISLEKDYKELTLALQNGLWKAAYVLAGSIIEAILIDHLLSFDDYQNQKFLDMSLHAAIAACSEKGIISEKTKHISYAIKSYRNLIHPGKTIRLGEDADESGAKVVQGLLEIIVKEISESKRKRYGYTAEQITKKIREDSSTNVILEHLLKNVSEYEKQRLLINIIPQQYTEYLNKRESQDIRDEDEYNYLSSILHSLSKSFHVIYINSSETTKKKVAENFVMIIKEQGSYEVNIHQNEFFKGNFLEYLSDENSKIVKQYLFSTLEKDYPNIRILKSLEGFGSFLKEEDKYAFTRSIIKYAFKTSKQSSASIEDIGNFLCEEYPKMPQDVKDYLHSFLAEDRWSIKNNNDKEKLAYLRNLLTFKTPTILDEDYPFEIEDHPF